MKPTKGLTLVILFIISGAFVTSCATYHHHGIHKHRKHKRVHRRAYRQVNRHKPRVVVVSKGHNHSASCGHYHHLGKWYHLDNHRHVNGCGHHFIGGVWVLE